MYFSLGPTRSYGNAQQNAAYMAVHALSRKIDGVYGHGPLISIDDDAEIHEHLLDIVWKVRSSRSERD